MEEIVREDEDGDELRDSSVSDIFFVLLLIFLSLFSSVFWG